MLEEPTDYGLHPDVLGQPRQAGPQATDSAHHEIDRDARARRLIEHVDDLGIDQRIILHPNRGRAAAASVGDFLLDMLADPVPQRERRNRHPFEPRRLRVAGDVVENVRDVARDDRIGSEER